MDVCIEYVNIPTNIVPRQRTKIALERTDMYHVDTFLTHKHFFLKKIVFRYSVFFFFAHLSIIRHVPKYVHRQ